MLVKYFLTIVIALACRALPSLQFIFIFSTACQNSKGASHCFSVKNRLNQISWTESWMTSMKHLKRNRSRCRVTGHFTPVTKPAIFKSFNAFQMWHSLFYKPRIKSHLKCVCGGGGRGEWGEGEEGFIIFWNFFGGRVEFLGGEHFCGPLFRYFTDPSPSNQWRLPLHLGFGGLILIPVNFLFPSDASSPCLVTCP